MSLDREVLRRLKAIEANQATLDTHLHTIIRNQQIMGAALDRLTAAVDGNSVATDALSDEVTVAIDYIKNHEAASNDPELLALAARLEEKNAKADKAKADLDASMQAVSASGGTP